MTAITTNGELLNFLEDCARDYCNLAKKSTLRNHNMNRLRGKEDKLKQRQIDALLVDYINYIGRSLGGNLGLRVEHLWKKNDYYVKESKRIQSLYDERIK